MTFENIKGSCPFMCPVKEIEMRETNGLLHSFEILEGTQKQKYPTADRNKMVKAYSRPAAGSKQAESEELRPPHVLLTTVQYLVTKLCTAGPHEFDEKINSTHTQECLKRLLCLYKQSLDSQFYSKTPLTSCSQNPPSEPVPCSGAAKHGATTNKHWDEENTILQKIESLNLSDTSDCSRCNLNRKNSVNESHRCVSSVALICTCQQAQFVAIYLLFNLGSPDAFRLALDWKHLLSKNNWFYLSLSITKAWLIQNYARVLTLAKDLPPLLLCALHRHIPTIHRCALQRMSAGFSNSRFTYPLRYLSQILLLNDAEDAKLLCEHYGLATIEAGVKFLRTTFNQEQQLPSLCQMDYITSRLQEENIDHLLLGDVCECLLKYTSM